MRESGKLWYSHKEIFSRLLTTVRELLKWKKYGKEVIAKLDSKNEARRSKPSKTQLENQPIIAKILEILANKPMLASEIATALEISTPKASGICKQLSIEGKINSIKTKNQGKRRGTCSQFKLLLTKRLTKKVDEEVDEEEVDEDVIEL